MRTFEFASKSSKDTHVVRVYDTGLISCSCRGFGSYKHCWHVEDAKRQMAEGIVETAVNPDELPEEERFIDPMLAKALKEGMGIEDFSTDQYVMEEKYDGHRIQLNTDESGAIAYARSGNVRDLPEHIMREASLLVPGTYDGELRIPGGTSTDVTALEFESQRVLVLWDVLRGGVTLTTALPLHARRNMLIGMSKALRQHHGYVSKAAIQIAKQFPVSQSSLQEIWDSGGEGAIIKNVNSLYSVGKRTFDWVKFKRAQAAELTVIGFKAGRLGPHSRIILRDDEGVEISVKSLNDHWRLMFDKNPMPFIGRRLVISYQEKTRDKKKYRHPMADHFVEDVL